MWKTNICATAAVNFFFFFTQSIFEEGKWPDKKEERRKLLKEKSKILFGSGRKSQGEAVGKGQNSVCPLSPRRRRRRSLGEVKEKVSVNQHQKVDVGKNFFKKNKIIKMFRLLF